MKVGQVALDDLRAKLAQSLSAFVLAPDQGAHAISFGDLH